MIASAPPVAVCQRCAFTTLDLALRDARSGETIVVHGVQRGNFVVRVPNVTLVGAPGAVLDGRGVGTVLTILAPNVRVRELAIRDGGADFVAMDSGIRSNAPRTSIRDVDVSNTLFGIYLAHSDESTIDHDRIAGRREIAIPIRGDALRIWYSRDVRVTNNHVQDARDDLIWFSNHALIKGNSITGGRYGIHTMYSSDMTIVSNVIQNCEVGSYAMYSDRLHVEKNIFANNRGSTGYGIGLKSIDDAIIVDNAFVSNHAGVYVDNSPSLEGSVDQFDGNLFAYNEIGFAGLPSARDDILLDNAFVQNYRQVAVLGGGTLRQLTWSRGKIGNYWSDYAGYDRDGDGVGDLPYEERSTYGMLSDLDSRLDVLAYSPAAAAIDFAARALPLFAPPASIVDGAPRMQPHYPEGLPQVSSPVPRSSYESFGIVALLLSFGVLIPLRRRHIVLKTTAPRAIPAHTCDELVIRVRNVRKRYGKTLALDGVDLDVVRGETLALWGPNGSGKTTLMRCLLGVVEFDGSIVTAGDPGYVPQQLPAFDMRVRELADFIAALRGVSEEAGKVVLRDAGLIGLQKRDVAELSGGQRQRLAVALAGLGYPAILLLDEPTVGLDLASRAAILHSMRTAKDEGKTIVIASHVPEDITVVADRVAIMEAGRIVAIASAEEFAVTIARQRDAAS